MTRRRSRRAAWVAGLLALVAAPLPAAEAPPPPRPIMGLEEIRAGQQGSAVTVLRGTETEEIPVEILGVLPAFAGPRRDVILARLTGPLVETVGVAAGMSGSPVTVDGRVIGALAYRIGAFTHEAIAGITPIEQMLSLPRESADVPPAAALPGNPEVLLEVLAGMRGPEEVDLPSPPGAAFPAAHTALALSGVHPLVEEHVLPGLRAAGLVPSLTAVAGAGDDRLSTLSGGDAVAAILIRGDMSVAGTGTVTWVDGERVLAFGHPLVRAGEVELPMAPAQIVLTVAAASGSFKLARVGEPVGAFHQDRATGVAGRLGAVARMTPLDMTVTGPGGGDPQHFRFELARSPMLSGTLTQLAVSNTLLSSDLGAVVGTIDMSGRVRVSGREPAAFRTIFPGGLGGIPVGVLAGRWVAGLAAVLERAALREEEDIALDLDCIVRPGVELLQIEDVRLRRTRVPAGEPVRATVILRDVSRGETVRQEIDLPMPELPSGTRVELLVGDAPTLARMDGEVPAAGAAGPDLEVLTRFLSRLRAPDHLYARLYRQAPGLILETMPLPDLPPSVAAVLGNDNSTRGRRRLDVGDLVTRSWSQRTLVQGAVRLAVTVD